MSALPDCWNSVVGFTRTEDTCINDAYPLDYSESLSGLYIDELQGMTLRILDNTDNSTTLWEKMTRARENAIRTFQTDLTMELTNYKEPTHKRFTGDIGGKSFTRTITGSTYYGLRMYSDIRGGKFILRGVSLILNSTEAVNLLIYDEYDLLYTIPLTSVAGRPHKTDFADIELTLDRNYYFLISPVGLPYANKLTCGCGGFKWCFCIDDPCYRYSRDRWTEWAMVAGVYGNDLTVREDWPTVREASGMILHGNFTCNIFDALCTDDSDFVNNELDAAMAWAILYKTGEFLTNYIMDTGEVSRYTLLGTEALNENRMYYNKRYAVLMDWIAQNMDDERNDCLKCKSPMGLRRRTQLI